MLKRSIFGHSTLSALCALAVLCAVARAQEYRPLAANSQAAPRTLSSGGALPQTLVNFGPAFANLQWPAVAAQVARRPWQNWGKEFFVTFLAAVGSRDDDPKSINRTLFIVSRAPARVYLEHVRGNWRDTVYVAPGQMARVSIPTYIALERNQYEVAVDAAIRIHSDQDISVYGYSHNDLSSDGFTAFPEESLGTEYVVMSVRNALNYQDPLNTHPRSEFAIIATENGTRINIHLTAKTAGHLLGDSTYSAILNRGDVLPIMAADTGMEDANGWYLPWQPGQPDCDLTGTQIMSDKPIAVFSGHERAASPSNREYDQDAAAVSRDHLVEQLPPIDMLGKDHLIVSSEQLSSRPQGGDMVRVVAAFDNTVVKINGVAQPALAAGKVIEFMAGRYCSVWCSQPALVVRFEQTALKPDTVTLPEPPGDPDMTIVRPLDTWANEYSLASWPDYVTFNRPRTMIVVDTSAISSVTVNGRTLAGFVRIPSTSYAYGHFNADGSEQRIEAGAACYAEAYGFGMMDSYTFAAGGEYSYVDSLFAPDIDFKTILCGSSRELPSTLHSRTTPALATDTIYIYGYEWVSGDTNAFELMDGVPQPLRLVPGQNLPVPVQFRPDQPRTYNAILRVWSSAKNEVLIHVIGTGIQPKIRVTPKLIDFGRVRLGSPQPDTLFTIENLGTADLVLTNPNYTSQVTDNTFGVASAMKTTIAPNTLIQIPIHLLPLVEGLHQATINVYSNDPDSGVAPKAPSVNLRVNVVLPKVASIGSDFGALRVGATSATRVMPIYNFGSDSTRIDSVIILKTSDVADFVVTLDTFPPTKLAPVHLGFQSLDSVLMYSARFSPQSLGKKRLVLAIYTPERTIYDTLTGVGVEPLVKVDPPVIDFGTITVHKIGDPNPTPTQFDTPFTVSNNGTLGGLLMRLVYHDSSHFKFRLDQPTVDLNEPLAMNASRSGVASFFVTEEGDFVDTLTVTNDTRYTLYGDTVAHYIPQVIVKAKVRTGPIDSTTVSFDTITTCDTLLRKLVLHNPYPVEIHIDSIRLGDTPSDTLGFAFGGFGFPINIAPDSTFTIPLSYAFPDELLNGSQTVTLILFQRQGGGQQPTQRRVTATLERKRRTLTLHAILPAWISSATDIQPMRMPITLRGPRANVGELDSFRLELKFSNDLFMPIGIDDSHSLLSPLAPNGYVHTNWDQATRTYTITAVGVPVSDPSRLNIDTLMTVIMRAFLTLDSEVTVTPTFTFLKHPCAYNLEPFTLSIPYANECGEPVIRDFMRGNEPVLDIVGIQANPLKHGDDLKLAVDLALDADLEVQVSDARGAVLGRFRDHRSAGRSELVIPSAQLPSSGTAFIILEVKRAAGDTKVQAYRTLATKSLKIAISE